MSVLEYFIQKYTNMAWKYGLVSMTLTNLLQIDSFRMDYFASGLKWMKTGAKKPTRGRELSNRGLATALEGKAEFTQQEWKAFGISNLRPDDYIRAGNSYFKPQEELDAVQRLALRCNAPSPPRSRTGNPSSRSDAMNRFYEQNLVPVAGEE